MAWSVADRSSGFIAVTLPGVGVRLVCSSSLELFSCVGGTLKEQEVILPVVTPEIRNELVDEGPTPTRAVRVT